jgi:hypothetical protein
MGALKTVQLVQAEGQRADRAQAAFARNATNGVPSTWQRAAVVQLADSALAQGDLTAARERLQNFLAIGLRGPEDAPLQLRLGQMLFRQYLVAGGGTNTTAENRALLALDFLLGPTHEMALVDGARPEESTEILQALHRQFHVPRNHRQKAALIPSDGVSRHAQPLPEFLLSETEEEPPLSEVPAVQVASGYRREHVTSITTRAKIGPSFRARAPILFRAA